MTPVRLHSEISFNDNCELTENDWKHLMTRTPAHTSNFDNALHLFPTVEAVVEHNINKLHGCGQPGFRYYQNCAFRC